MPGASCSRGCHGLSPTVGRETAVSSLSSRGFWFLCPTRVLNRQSRLPFVPTKGQAGRQERCKGDVGPSPPTHCSAPWEAAVAPPALQLPRVLLSPTPPLSFHNLKRQSLAGAFHRGFDGRRPLHPVQGEQFSALDREWREARDVLFLPP